MTTHYKPRLTVFVDTPPFFIRPKNTDWLYMKTLSALSDYEPLDIRFSSSLADSMEESGRYAATRLGIGRKAGSECYRRSGRFIGRHAKQADVVLCHRRFPSDLDRPVIWQHAVLDPRMQHAAGRPQNSCVDYRNQASVYEDAAVVQVSTEAEAARHRSVFPALAGRFEAVPFFLPHIRPVSDDEVLEKHRNDTELRVLFVGREARRKGLDLLLAAVTRFPAELSRRVRLDVVSSLSDGPVSMPAREGIRLHRSLPRAEVLKLMRAAHVFAMPSRFESYGFTYVEAMASGCAVLGPDWEVQSELLANGRAGINVAPNARAVGAALISLCTNAALRTELARQALQQYRARHSPEAAARLHYQMIERAASSGR